MKLFNYCERGNDPGFWAEPLNAWTNLAFIAAGALSLWYARRQPGRQSLGVYFLIATVFAIGAGSFLFHTLATRGAVIADIVPIGVFMLAYLGYVLRNFLRWSLLTSAAGAVAFFALLQMAQTLRCGPGGIGIAGPGHLGPCLNGSIGYLPAFAAMGAAGAASALMRHPAARWLLAAAAVFAVSLTFRTYDWAWCAAFTAGGKAIGTHFLWHILNTTTLFLLLMAAIRHGKHPAPAKFARWPASARGRPARGVPST